MAETVIDRIKYLDDLATKLQRRLRVLEIQIAGYGQLAAPVHIIVDYEDTKEKLEQAL